MICTSQPCNGVDQDADPKAESAASASSLSDAAFQKIIPVIPKPRKNFRYFDHPSVQLSPMFPARSGQKDVSDTPKIPTQSTAPSFFFHIQYQTNKKPKAAPKHCNFRLILSLQSQLRKICHQAKNDAQRSQINSALSTTKSIGLAPTLTQDSFFTIACICSHFCSMSATSLNWVRQRSRLWSSLWMWK